MKIIINGAGGWLGRSTAIALSRSGLGIDSKGVRLFGQTDRITNIGPWSNKTIEKLSYSNFVSDQHKLFIQLAFKTRDYIERMGEKEYISANRQILRNSIELFKRSAAKSVVVVSSGVVGRYIDSEGVLDDSAYTRLKIEEEQQFADACSSMNSRLLILRLWGSSGEDMTEPSKYAIGDLIKQALKDPVIKVNANRLVYRRYLDSRDQMEIAIRASLEPGSLIMDSGGEIIEMGQLAVKVRDMLATGKGIVRPPLTQQEPDVYFSTSTITERLAKRHSISVLSLENQIIETSKAVYRSLDR